MSDEREWPEMDIRGMPREAAWRPTATRWQTLLCEQEKGPRLRLDMFDGKARTPLKIRGLHVDIARHFIQPATLLRIIDRMAQLRLNTLHLHLSDDQGFPVAFEAYPEVQSPQMWLIRDQRRIARACAAAGIEIIPEIDIPGHARAFLSYFHKEIEPERQMGVITQEYIDIEEDLPIILGMFEELVTRFDAKRIHMGGDEANRYPRFPELITKVCAWAAARDLEVIAWDEVLTVLPEIPSNLIVQRWRRGASARVSTVPHINSWGYYLDHADDPFTMYERSPQMNENSLGCIACMWTEWVTDETIEATIFPSLYILAHRWWTFPRRERDAPVLLKALCDRYGYPDVKLDTWQTRRGFKFYSDDPRSSTSVTVDDVLDRDQDLYPVFSPALVRLCDALYRSIHHGQRPSHEALALLSRFGQEALGDDLHAIWARERGWKKVMNRLMREAPTSRYHNNGLIVAIKRAMRKPLSEAEQEGG